MTKSTKTSIRNILLILIVFFCSALVVFLSINNFITKRNKSEATYGKYQFILHDISIEKAKKIKADKTFYSEEFIQLITQNKNNITRMIWTNDNYFELAMNKLIVGSFPNSANKILIDCDQATLYGMYYSDAIGKKITIRDKEYVISGIITKDCFMGLDYPTSVFILNMEFFTDYYENDSELNKDMSVIKEKYSENNLISKKSKKEFNAISLIIKKNGCLPFFLKNKLCSQYKIDPKFVEYNRAFLEDMQVNMLYLPIGPDSCLGFSRYILIFFGLMYFLIFLVTKNTNQHFFDKKRRCYRSVVIFAMVISANVSLYNCFNSTIYNQYQKSDYNIKVSCSDITMDALVTEKTKSDAYAYKYATIDASVSVNDLSKEYTKYLKKLSTDYALTLSKKDTIRIPVILICENHRTNIISQSCLTNKDKEFCISINRTTGQMSKRLPINFIEGNQITFFPINFYDGAAQRKVMVTGTASPLPIFSTENFSGMPIFFVNNELFDSLSTERKINTTVYLKSYESTPVNLSDLCGSNVTDLRTKYTTQEKNKMINMLEIVVLLFISALFNIINFHADCISHKKIKIFLKLIITILSYIITIFFSDYILYKHLITVQNYYVFYLPILQSSISILVILLSNLLAACLHWQKFKQLFTKHDLF